ncbi:MAG: restriction endonuclease [Armatimonadetes bacterium]|nr:restriction endonuclease [Armatimonadota bacterium]
MPPGPRTIKIAREFELFVQDFYRSQGFEIVDTAGRKECGLDFIAKKELTRIGVQVKCNPRRGAGVSAVRQTLKGHKLYKCTFCHLVVLQDFSRDAVKLANQVGQNQVRLINSEKFMEKLDAGKVEGFRLLQIMAEHAMENDLIEKVAVRLHPDDSVFDT